MVDFNPLFVLRLKENGGRCPRSIVKLNNGHNFLQPSCISMKLRRFIPMAILHTYGDFWVKKWKVKVIMHCRKTITKINIGHNFLQPSWISMKLCRVFPLLILCTCGDFWVKRSNAGVIMHYKRTLTKIFSIGHNFLQHSWISMKFFAVKGQGHNAL